MERHVAFQLKTEFIALSQLLKAVDFADSGADAKHILLDGGVTVNGEPEARRGRKIRPGDVVRMPNGDTIRVS